MPINSERKLEIFVGATKRDLEKERLKVIEAILEDGHIPSGMELWASDIEPTRKTILNHLARCDMHLILLGARYGETIDDSGEDSSISFTEWEYKQSEGKRPVVAFVLDGKDFEKARAQVILEDPREKNRTSQLVGFRKAVLNSRFCRSFRFSKDGVGDLGRLCATAIHKAMDSPDLPKTAGWMKADSEDLRRGREIRENPFLDRVLARLRQFSTLTKRVIVARESKESLAKVFWDSMIGSIRNAGYSNLFFESGSTIAYVSHQFEADILEIDKDISKWKIRTNNVETLLQLILHTNEDVGRLPIAVPDPDDPYGAIFPPHWRQIRQDKSLKPRRLYRSENSAIAALKKEVKQALPKGLFLATTSGLDLDHSEHHFRGPHVGSHPNMLFKRGIFTTEMPVVLFLHAEKLGDPFRVGKCFPVFGPDLGWKSARQDYPFAVCVGYRDRRATTDTDLELLTPDVALERNDPKRIKRVLSALGFKHLYADTGHNAAGAIIAANDAFKDVLPKH